MVLQQVYSTCTINAVTFVKSTLGNVFNGIERMTCKMLPLQKITMKDPAEKKWSYNLISLQNMTLCRISDFKGIRRMLREL
jgi:hypothetical protein